jgi:hypothetical protein
MSSGSEYIWGKSRTSESMEVVVEQWCQISAQGNCFIRQLFQNAQQTFEKEGVLLPKYFTFH